MRLSNRTLVVGFVVSLLLTCLLGGYRIVSDVKFNQDCGGHLKRAADANSVELAEKELGIAIKYLEVNGLTAGYTSILWRTPDEDIGFWYTNLTSAQDELRATLNKESSTLEKSNQLIKLRETLLDSNQGTTHITYPAGIQVYPHNASLAFTTIIVSVILFLFTFPFLVILHDIR